MLSGYTASRPQPVPPSDRRTAAFGGKLVIVMAGLLISCSSGSPGSTRSSAGLTDEQQDREGSRTGK